MHENTNSTVPSDASSPAEAAVGNPVTEAAAPSSSADPRAVSSALLSGDPSAQLSGDPSAPVRFDTKVVVVLRDGLLPWQELNVTAFLMSGIAASEDDLVGENYRDADGNDYLPMLRQPVMVMSADAEKLKSIRSKALGRGIPTAVYTEELFSTGHDAANRAAVALVPAEQLNLVGVAMRGAKNAVDRTVKGARMHD
ncbi:DUF2000 family protein [Brevibacterium sp. CFH 10365]|uniref:DUF2000 family protein n=1 Tax=Brevibacterium sp. CFH 10365 TaxID=2585207 RepID=UPI0012662D14|nr:DUF2000 family protein [Brevibacterium sp. CFH 10365]